MKKHIELLLKAEDESENQLMWNRASNNVLWISTVGYKVMEHVLLEEQLIKSGCQYDFSKQIQNFDKTNGRTITYFTEP